METPSMLTPTPHVARTLSSSSSTPFVHRFYILLKVHYFLFFSAFGMLYPILNITLRGRGLSNTELSYINIIVPFLVFLTNPLLGYVADRSRRYLITFNIVLAICTILYSVMFLLPMVKTRNIEAKMVYDQELGRILDFCASQEVGIQCASRSECGCTYQANCTSIKSLNEKKYLFFNFSMNSKETYKEIQGTTDMSKSKACGTQYLVPVEQAIKQQTQNGSIDK
jgi:hypothetical protein